jgi:hypothetical protein
MAGKITDKDPACVKRLIESFEKCGSDLVKYKSAAVKRNAAIRELMKVSVDVAELCDGAVRDGSEGGREHLVQVWGGTCEKICRLLIVLAEIDPELPEEYASKGQWQRCHHNIETIKKVLEDLGKFKLWNPQLGAQPPSNLRYATKNRFSPSEKLNIMPEFDGGDPSEFSIDKPLPDGLKFDTRTGCITGRSTQGEVPETVYTVTAKNDRGACSAPIAFAIGPPPPSGLSYANPNLMYVGEAVYWKPTVEGIPTKWNILPALPQGLELQEDGTVSGICGRTADATSYKVTCGNNSGEDSTDLTFEIKAAPPISLRYTDLKPEYFEKENLRITPELKLKKAGESILEAFARRAVSGRGPAKLATLLRNKALNAAGVKFTVEPPLPAGLGISPSTGVISGTPETSQDQVVYKVTATNPSGSVSCDVPLTIRCAAPENVRYPNIKRTYFTGEAVSESPLYDGVVDKWSMQPALPDGLTLQTDTGVITGVPTTPSAMASYEITATNDIGEGKCVAELEVIRAAPKNLKYIDAQSVYPKLATVAMNPVCEGENVTYTVEPALVPGLTMDPATGVISGAPQEITPEIPYKVIASNETGSCETVVPFAVEVKPPTDLHYEGVLPQYNVGESVCLAPTLQGGADKFSIEPALVSGMTFDEKSGVIAGAPKQVSSPETHYTVTAENEGGGTSTVVSFEVVPLPPKDLRYIGVKDEYNKDEPIRLEADTVNCIGCVYSIEPPLPAGMAIDTNTAFISGAPSELCDPTEYTVTATNQSGVCSTTFGFAVREPADGNYVDQEFARRIDECTDIAELLAMEPAKDKAYGNWMVWMVHRAYLNDPSLVEFNFSNMIMPTPKIEWRVAPKLMEALATNTTIETLMLPASNLRRTEGKAFAEALGKNSSLRTVDVASNDLDQNSIKACAVSLKANADTKLEKFAFSNNAGLAHFGAPTEEAIYELLKTNKTICKLGCSLQNPGYRDGINRALLRNGDIQRKLRRAGGAAVPSAATKKTLKQVMLDDPPTDKAAFEVFPPEDAHLTKTREYIAEKRVVPNAQALQTYMKSQGTPVGFSAVGPLLKKVRGLLLDASKQHEVTCCDASGNDTKGVLKDWKEQNKNWNLQVMIGTSKLFSFETTNDPEIRVGDAMAKWLS